MDDIEFNLLSVHDVNRLRKYTERFGKDVVISKNTDLAAILGGEVTYGAYYLSNLVSRDGIEKIGMVDYFGDITKTDYVFNKCSIRPTFYSISLYCKFEDAKALDDKTYIVEYGYYPQTAENLSVSSQLEKLYQESALSCTGNSYTLGEEVMDRYPRLRPIKYDEYEYNGIRYVRVDSNLERDIELSNGQIVGSGDSVWVRVEPIKWILEPDGFNFTAKDCLMSGIDYSNSVKRCPLKKSQVYRFMNRYMKYDMFQYYIKGDKYDYIDDNQTEDIEVLDTPSQPILFDNNFNLSTQGIDNIYIQLDEANSFNKLFVLYRNGQIEIRNRRDDKNFGPKVNAFVSSTGIKNEDNKLWKLSNSRENEPVFLELTKKYYLNKFNGIMRIIDNSIVTLACKNKDAADGIYEHEMVELLKIKETTEQYIEQINAGSFDFLLDGVDGLEVKELEGIINKLSPSAKDVLSLDQLQDVIKELEVNLTVIDNLVDTDSIKRR